MPLELGTQGAGPVANASGLGPQFRIIHHLFHIAEPIGPVEKIAAGERRDLLRIEFIEGGDAPAAVRIIQAASPLATAALALPPLSRTVLTVALSRLVCLLIL
jgi:hypothetical protein